MRPGRWCPAAPAALAPLLLLAGVLLGPVLAGPAQAVSAAASAPGSAVGGPGLDTSGVVQSPGTDPLPDGLTGASFVVADLDSGDVLAARDPHGRYGPASTIKTLTALALIPVLDPERRYTPTAEDIDLPLDSSRVGIVAGVEYPVRELFEGLMLMSGNDTANALAGAAGGIEKTLGLMAAEAERLQARDTVAKTAHGLDADGQVSSAYDLALIARAGMGQPDFARYASTKRSSMAAPEGQRFEIASKNKLLWNYEGALGIKNGYTSTQRASFVGAAERDGRRLVVTAMRGEPAVWKEVASLLDWGFAQPATARPVGRLVEPLRPAPLAYGDTASTETVAAPGSGTPTPTSPLLADPDASLLRQPTAEEGSPWGARLGSLALVLAATVVALRVRAVRLQRRRRAQAQRRSAARRPPGGRGGAPGAGRGAPRQRPGLGELEAGAGRPRRVAAVRRPA